VDGAYFTIGGSSCEKTQEETKMNRIYNFVFNGFGFYYISKIKLKTAFIIRKEIIKRYSMKNMDSKTKTNLKY